MPINRDKKQDMIPFTRALEIASEHLPEPRAASLVLLDALGMVAASDHVSTENVPPHDNSAMDGYAVVAQDCRGASKDSPVVLEVQGVIPAGSGSSHILKRGAAYKIMTGAVVPDGADSVIPIEDTDGNDHNVSIYAEPRKGQHVRFTGEDVCSGDIVEPGGSLLRPANLGSLASVGIARVEVWDRPNVAVLVTGDELIGPGQPLQKGKIRNSNATSLCAQVTDAGAVPDYRGNVPDDLESLLSAVQSAAESSDFVLTTGGVSMGDYDFVADVLGEAGFTTHFAWVAQRPGAPLTFATRGRTMFFGLPGNPASVMICFELHVRPLLRRFMRHPEPERPRVRGCFAQPFPKRRGLMHAARVIAEQDRSGAWTFNLSGPQGSGLLRSMADCNALVYTPPDLESVPVDRELEALLLR